MRFLILTFLIGSALSLKAQVLIDADRYKKLLDEINTTDQLPAGLLAGKAVVIHAYPEAIKNYKEHASAIQPGFQKAGIDAVAHYLFEDIFSGKEVITSYEKQLKDREIDFVIYYTAGDNHKLLIMPLKNGFFGNSAYGISDSNQKDLMHGLYLRTARSDQDKTNLLILEVPGYPDFPKVIEGRRAEFYDLNMKSGKVAIPKTLDSVMNTAIDSVMANHYPYKYGFVEPGLTESELRKDGYWFVLYGIHSTGKSVKKLLEYKTEKKETAYASVVADGRETEVETIPIDIPVFKFYIKHIQSKDAYLGKHYDAAETWERSLKNYIRNLRNILE